MSSSTAVIHSFYNWSNWDVASQRAENDSVINASDSAAEIVIFQPFSYYLIGSLMTTIMVIGFSTNLAILYTYATNRKIRTVDNTLIIGLALSDIGQAIFGIPFVAISSFSKHWIFGHALCQYYAFITTSFGIAQIAMLTVIAMERYFVIVRHDKRLTNTPLRCMIMILGSFLYGSSWATGPLLGWSGYKEEEIGIACCVKWEIKDSVALSYTISLCTFGWFIPLFLIAFGYISIACSIYNERNKRLYMRREVASSKSNRERKVAITVLIMIGAFIVSWTPYSAVSLWSAVGDFDKIPLWVQVVPAVFAKCSIIWNPVIYVARHENFRQGIKQSLSHLNVCAKSRNPNDMNVINTYQQANRRQQQYKALDTHHISDQKKQSVTSDNCITYIDSAARSKSSSSVFLKSPTPFKRGRFRRHLTYISTLDSSQQIAERSETEYLKIEKSVIHTASKCTQTDRNIVGIYYSNKKQTTDKFVQTDCLSPRLPNAPEPTADHNATLTSKSEAIIHIKNDEDIKRPVKIVRQHETAVNDKSKELKHANTIPRNSTFQKTKSLEVLKKKRKELKQQLEIIYHDQHQIERLPVQRQISQPLSFTPSTLHSNQQDPLIHVENRIGRRHSGTITSIPYKPNMYMPNKRLKSMPKGYLTSCEALLPNHLQKRERFRNKMLRERIISEPTEMEMKTYIYKPFTTGSQSIKETTTDRELMMNTYFMNQKSVIVRQSTV